MVRRPLTLALSPPAGRGNPRRDGGKLRCLGVPNAGSRRGNEADLPLANSRPSPIHPRPGTHNSRIIDIQMVRGPPPHGGGYPSWADKYRRCRRKPKAGSRRGNEADLPLNSSRGKPISL